MIATLGRGVLGLNIGKNADTPFAYTRKDGTTMTVWLPAACEETGA